MLRKSNCGGRSDGKKLLGSSREVGGGVGGTLQRRAMKLVRVG